MISNYPHINICKYIVTIILLCFCLTLQAKVIRIDVTKDIFSQFKTAGAIYEIESDINLDGKTLNLPLNSILNFYGGSFSNGRINGNNSTISGILTNIFSGVVLEGQFTNSESNLSWWGCVPFSKKNEYDNSASIGDAFHSSIKVIKVSAMYGISQPVSLSGSIRVEGVNSWEYKQTGFIACSNFRAKEITLTRDNKKYIASGMFYHSYDQKPEFRDLSIDANKKAKFAIEHIAGYSWCNLNNVYITSALTAGFLQYGAEMPNYNNVCISNSNIGCIISSKRLLDNDIYLPSGERMGSPNLVNFSNCTFANCNYGCVINGGSNYSLRNVKTSYNGICGLIIIDTLAYIDNYYTEGDGICNSWIDVKTGYISSTKDKSKALSLITKQKRRDGFTSSLKSLHSANVFYRAPVFIRKSMVQINTAFISLKPRSSEEKDAKKIIIPSATEEIAGGVDACFISNESTVSVSNINLYLWPNNYATNSSPFAFVIDLVTRAGAAGQSAVTLNNLSNTGRTWEPCVYRTSTGESIPINIR